MTWRARCLAVLVGIVLGAGTLRAADEVILGSKVLIKDPTGVEDQRQVKASAKESATSLPAILPQPGAGATLTVFTAGTTPGTQTFALGGTWVARGSSGWKYIASGTSPVRSLLLRRTASGTAQLKFLVKGNVGTDLLAIVPPNPGTEAAFVIDNGNGTRYCVRLGGPAGGAITKNGRAELKIVATRAAPAIEVGCPTATTAPTTTVSTTTVPTTTVTTTSSVAPTTSTSSSTSSTTEVPTTSTTSSSVAPTTSSTSAPDTTTTTSSSSSSSSSSTSTSSTAPLPTSSTTTTSSSTSTTTTPGPDTCCVDGECYCVAASCTPDPCTISSSNDGVCTTPGTCRPACQTNDDCAAGLFCFFPATSPVGICVGCQGDSSVCPAGTFCQDNDCVQLGHPECQVIIGQQAPCQPSTTTTTSESSSTTDTTIADTTTTDTTSTDTTTSEPTTTTTTPSQCGDGQCNGSEDCTTCCADCGTCPAVCGNGVCEESENGANCPGDCPASERPLFPVAIKDCSFQQYHSTGNCSDLPTGIVVPNGAQVGCFTSFLQNATSTGAIIEYLPTSCGGGGAQQASLSIGTSINLITGATIPDFRAIQDCFNQGFTEWVVPVVPCNTNCNQAAAITSFVRVRIKAVTIQGANKTITMDAICGDTCGDGTCTAGETCSTCGAECGGCPATCPAP